MTMVLPLVIGMFGGTCFMACLCMGVWMGKQFSSRSEK